MTLKICVAQLNYCVGDMPGNAQKIIDAARAAYADGARLLLTPELAICGYAAEDLFLRASFIEACDDAVNRVARELAGLKGLTVVVGTPAHVGSGKGLRTKSVAVHQLHNAARVLREGEIIATYAKRELPNYQVFDERRYFAQFAPRQLGRRARWRQFTRDASRQHLLRGQALARQFISASEARRRDQMAFVRQSRWCRRIR